jgi:prefoldin subunit 5
VAAAKDDNMEITKDTKLADLIAQYPWLKAEMAKVNEKFKMLNTPVGKIMLGKATIAEMSKKSGMEIDKLVSRLKTLIEEHKD